MRKILIILSTLLFVGCVDNNLTTKGVEAFDAEKYTIAYKELAPLAAQGNPEAQFYIAKMNHLGYGIPKDLDKAFVLYADSAEQGYMRAQHNLGFMFLDGLSVNVNHDAGYEWISKAAAQGFDVSQAWMGLALTAKDSPFLQDIPRGLEYYKAAAAQDYAPALTRLGAYYSGAEIDLRKAGDFLEKAALLGDAEAMFRLHFGYMSGDGINLDQTKAFNLLKDSADNKFLQSYFYLGNAYLFGTGVKQDVGEAIYWLKKSATKANNPQAMESLAQIQIEYRSGYLTKVAVIDSIESGIKLRKKAAELGDVSAQLRLYTLYADGVHVPANQPEAIKWLKVSAKGGNSNAQYELARRYMNGWEVTKDQKKAAALYESAAENGHLNAILNVGACYASGLGVSKNFTVALNWLNKTKNSKEADLIRGLIFSEGDSKVPQNRETAEAWLRKSGLPEAMVMLPILYMVESYGAINLDRAARLADQVEQYLDSDLLLMLQRGLGLLYLDQKNSEDGVFWLSKASGAGDADAQLLLGGSLVRGDGIEVDIEKGRYWLSKSATSGNSMAALWLGMSYSGGNGQGIVNPVSARHWLRESARGGEPLAAMMLGLTYAGDIGGDVSEEFSVDLVSARYWLEIAIKLGHKIASEPLALITKIERQKVKRMEEIERKTALKESRERQAKLALIEAQKRELYKPRQPRNKSFMDTIVNSFFEGLGGGIGIAVSMKINKELGLEAYDRISIERRNSKEIYRLARKAASYEVRKANIRRTVMKNLQTPAKVGCESYGC